MVNDPEASTTQPSSVPPGINLDDLAQTAPKVEVGGKHFPVVLSDRLGLKKAAQAQRLGRKFLSLGEKMSAIEDPESEEGSVEEERLMVELEGHFERFLDIIVPSMPEDVRATLTDDQKMALVAFFAEQAARQRASLRVSLPRTSPGSPSTAG